MMKKVVSYVHCDRIGSLIPYDQCTKCKHMESLYENRDKGKLDWYVSCGYSWHDQ